MGLRQSIWSNSQISDKAARTKLAKPATSRTKLSDGPPKPSTHTRAFSFSTVYDTRKSAADQEDGILRIVIDRSAIICPPTMEQYILPALDISIPHYRLGKPHFSDKGTPALRNSAYTRTSEGMSENLKSASALKNDYLSADTRTEIRVLSNSSISDTFLNLSGTITDAPRESAGPTDCSTDHNDKMIDPAFFEKLASYQDDPSVVRYSQRTGAITAATPARIVAQISSEAFMDYDLVSDFFLTFRAYLATEDLLNLLLARLRWAINRLEEDGRIIRIRTFAALRHWILNYFVDDFVVNRKLRVQFCDQTNDMYHQISQRTGRGISDMKILVDLKRCWNGRCSLYWDSAAFIGDTQQEADIEPGGVMGSRDASLSLLNVILDQESSPVPDVYRAKANIRTSWYGEPPSAHAPKIHDKQTFCSSAEVPVSPTSEQSLQAASCSIPAIAFKRSPTLEGSARAPHPVSLQLKKLQPAGYPNTSAEESQRRLTYAHRRSLSTSDSIRDRGSGIPSSRPAFLTDPHAGSLIRGNVYPPAPPFVDVISSESPSSQRSHVGVSSGGLPSPFESGAKSGSSANPGLKSLMGSIRRALSSKQAGSTPALSVEDSGRFVPSLHGKKSGLPLNMSRSIDNLRERKGSPAARHHLRIDLLCAAVSQSYQMTQAKASQESCVNHGLGLSISDIREDSVSQHSFDSRDFAIEVGNVQHILGQEIVHFAPTTADDTAGRDSSNTEKPVGRSAQGELSIAGFDYTTAGMMSMPLLSTERSANRGGSSHEAHRRSSSVDTALARRSKDQRQTRGSETADVATTLDTSHRKESSPSQTGEVRVREQISRVSEIYPSAQDSSRPLGQRPSLRDRKASSSTKQSKSILTTQASAHTLRRRPGGNLRKIENVHDLAPGLRRQSTGSFTARSDSVGSMLVIGGNKVTGLKHAKPIPDNSHHPVSLIRTHSSQHLRPSFEAAISGFSTIPDDEDGGLEATLLKLEGRYERSPPKIAKGGSASIHRTKIASAEGRLPVESKANLAHSKSAHSLASTYRSNPRLRQPASTSKIRKLGTKTVSTRSGQSKSSVANSDGSYSSIPLLERGLVNDLIRKPKNDPKLSSAVKLPRPLFEAPSAGGYEKKLGSSDPSIGLGEKTEGSGSIPQGSILSHRPPSTRDGSFLLDDDDNLSDLSSELSVEVEVDDCSDVKAHLASPAGAAPIMAVPGHELPLHPLAHPPSPASSFHHAVTSVPAINPMLYQQKPLTPLPSPTQGEISSGNQVPLSQILSGRKSATVASATVTTSAGHIPFVLACESEILAQQLTLVEKAALSEIEWSDLVDMKWENKSPSVLNWVDYLAAKDNKGVDIVINRFNIVVKWVLSEIVMTQDIFERSRAIIKYIHIASHARQLHNYASMLQITIALTSIDCTRLKATWDMVPDKEKTLLNEVETLIQPIRNFHELRVEMETANLQNGCIPFLGKYTVHK